MKPGDYVVVPAPKKFHVYEIADNAPFAVRDFPEEIFSDLAKSYGGALTTNAEGKLVLNGDQLDLGFFRPVKKIQRNIPRSEYADSSLTSRMKYRGSNINCNGMSGSIENAVSAFNSKKPINLHSLILDKHQKSTLDIIKAKLNPDKFEKLIAWYFQKLGAETDIPAKNESHKKGDADVVAIFNSIGVMICVQAKFHDEKTGKWGVTQIEKYYKYIRDEMCDKNNKDSDDKTDHIIAWLVSTADDFTEECTRKAGECKTRLVNGEEFVKMLLEVGISDLGGFANI
ncbi:restriction endonuclease [Candidatus Spongiihabitans sp.]|uniref:restriction endonuclease n=1 Tax=Candidatus Spongiihabitans sp. TaxID=3101308 RepID=UPI003C6FAF89